MSLRASGSAKTVRPPTGSDSRARISAKTLGRPEGSSGEATRARLLEVAAALFANGGFSSVTLADIAGAAGLTAPSIYNHFSSKDELFIEVLSNIYEEIATAFRQAAAGSGGWQDRVGRILEAAQLVYREDGTLQRLGGLARQKIDQDPQRFARVAQAKRNVDLVFEEIVAQAVDDGELPSHLDAELGGDLLASMGMIGSAATLSPQRRSANDFRKIVHAFKEMFLNAGHPKGA